MSCKGGKAEKLKRLRQEKPGEIPGFFFLAFHFPLLAFSFTAF
jgi:hypothetical protein